MTSIEFGGEQFTLNADVSADAMADFAEAAAGVKESDKAATMESVITIRAVVWDCIIAADLDRFKATSRRTRAGIEEWTAVLNATVAQQAERPTSRSSDSSTGPIDIAASSVVNSADRVLEERLPGRPDLQLAVLHTKSA
jgi:hypothetical protein